MYNSGEEFFYDTILKTFIEKYRDIFTSLYTINDEENDYILDEHLLHELFFRRFVVLKPEAKQHHVWAGVGRKWNRYGLVIRGTARYTQPIGGTKHVPFTENDSVVLYGSRNKESIQEKIFEFVSEIASIIYIEQSNLRLSNVKGVIEGTPSTVQTMENIFNDMFRSGKSWIVAKRTDKAMQDATKLDLNVNYIASEYQSSMIFYHNQILEILGVNFVPMEKKERQVVDEVNANNELTMSISNKFVSRIQKYLDNYNNIYDTKFKIEKSIIRDTEQEQEVDEEKHVIDEKKEVKDND